MWVFSTRGFYSAVEKYEDRREQMVTVRARVKADLERLLPLLPEDQRKPYRKRGYSDYPWRIRCKREDWALAVARMAMEVDYVNFKDKVRMVLGLKREHVYHNIWSDLLDLEEGGRYGRYSGTYTYGQWGEGTAARPASSGSNNSRGRGKGKRGSRRGKTTPTPPPEPNPEPLFGVEQDRLPFEGYSDDEMARLEAWLAERAS